MGRARRSNEDAVALLAASGFASGAVICDGVGGAAAGEVASRLGVEQLAASLSHSSGSLDVRLRSAIRDANEAVREHSRTYLEGAATASTLVAALISRNRATIGHLGDSRAYLFREGQLAQLTSDHSFVAEQVRAGVLRPQDVATHPLRSRLMKALGVADDADADLREVDLLVGDVLLLCSDGLHAMASDADIAAALTTSPSESARALVLLANERGGRDNITVAVYRAD